MGDIRLQAALAKAGIASRRKAAELIESNRVKVNGRVVTDRGFRVDTSRDVITFDEKPITLSRKKQYYILNKPKGVLSTASDERGRKTVLSYVKAGSARLYPVGRLDKDTKGLIMLTNDGDMTYRLTHPKFRVERVYEVLAEGALDAKKTRRLKNGVMVDGKTAKVEKIVFRKKQSTSTSLLVTMLEGRKREVRRMFEVVGHKILELKRLSYGPLKLKGLREGEARPLTADEIRNLRVCVGLK